MFKNLFTRKPIYQITLAHQPTKEEYDTIKTRLIDELGDEYKIVVIVDIHKVHIETNILK
jgi:hypothetical protein